MESTPSASLIERFSILVDPRDDRAKRHSRSILLSSGMQRGGRVDVEMFSQSPELPNGSDTGMIDSGQFAWTG